jgi:hypothetical protein
MSRFACQVSFQLLSRHIPPIFRQHEATPSQTSPAKQGSVREED